MIENTIFVFLSMAYFSTKLKLKFYIKFYPLFLPKDLQIILLYYHKNILGDLDELTKVK
jgi:hypothetical protein